MIPCRIYPIVDGGTQIIDIQFDQCFAQILCKCDCLIFECSQHNYHAKADDCLCTYETMSNKPSNTDRSPAPNPTARYNGAYLNISANAAKIKYQWDCMKTVFFVTCPNSCARTANTSESSQPLPASLSDFFSSSMVGLLSSAFYSLVSVISSVTSVLACLCPYSPVKCQTRRYAWCLDIDICVAVPKKNSRKNVWSFHNIQLSQWKSQFGPAILLRLMVGHYQTADRVSSA